MNMNTSLKSSLFSPLPSLLLLWFSANVFIRTRAISFDFGTLALSGFKFLGDADVFNNSIRLTGDFLVPNTSAGSVFFNKPVRFRQPASPIPSSFATKFSFSITELNAGSIGGGMAFVISPTDDAVGGPGGILGIPTGAIAVEFDSRMDVEFKDVNGNHVGLDLGSMVSTHVADLYSVKVNSWIDYSGSTHQLNIFISCSHTKPKSPVLSIVINLNKYVKEFMFVGFSGSTHESTELHSLQRWFFNSSSGFNSPPSPPPSQPTKRHSLMLIITIACVVMAALVAAGGGAFYCIYIRHCDCSSMSVNCCNWRSKR